MKFMFETTKQFCLAQLSKAIRNNGPAATDTPVPLMDVARQLTELTSNELEVSQPIGPFRCYQKDLKGDDSHVWNYAHVLHVWYIYLHLGDF